jgi:hypothetical protein
MNTMANKRIFKIDIEDKSCPSKNVSLLINGISYKVLDFGIITYSDRVQYECNNIRFFPKPAKQAFLDANKISVDEYFDLCEKIASLFEDEIPYSCGACK